MTKITTTDAPTLDALCDLLNDASEERHRWEGEQLGSEALRVDERYDVTSLPVYGELNPEDTQGIYSWDDTRVLVISNAGWARPWSISDVD